MTSLFSPIQLGNLTVPNRIMVSPMCQYSATQGIASAWHTAHISNMALSGAGLICMEATAVSPEGRISPNCLGLWDAATEASLKQALAAVRAVSSTKIAIQLGHAGRKAATAIPWQGGQQLSRSQGYWETFAPSAIAQNSGEIAPIAMGAEHLQQVLNSFKSAAQRSVRLGIEAIELHAAHGYLLHQFLSPIANQRNDAYGGKLENRMRFPLEVFEAIKQVVPSDYPVGIRVSATDWLMEESWDPEQTIIFAKELKQLGLAWIDVSSGGISPKQKIKTGPGYQVGLAKSIKESTGIPTIAVGMITTAQQAEDILNSDSADMVALGRAMLYNPRWPWHAAEQLKSKVYGPPQYWRALPADAYNIFK